MMNPRSRFSLRVCFALLLLVALLLPSVSFVVSEAAPEQSSARQPPPHPGKPEGTLPDLDELQQESQFEREAPPPIPSTVRSLKNPLQPWDGKRVGDPTEGKLDQPPERRQIQRAHARRRALNPALPDTQFVQNFFNWTLLRLPNSDEATFWNDQFRVAYAQGAASVKLAAVTLGKTLFESSAYAQRNRDNHWYVYDLYKTFLMREPDAAGWAHWESVVPTNGRENVRRAFEEAPEFAAIVTAILPNGSATASAASLISARVNPRNQPGHGMLARDVNWSVSLLSLPGRSGLDLGLALAYSSQVWTRSGPYIHFDEDNGFPSPGFRLGFPVIQRKTFDAQTAKNAFLLITPAGQRVELRQVGATNVYEAADSSYLQLSDNSSHLLLRSTDGTQLSFVEINNEFNCTQVKDRNGNYITINHNALGRINTITDTLGRIITFNYDSNANLLSITQAWNGQPSHQWASFGWGTRNMQSSFSANVGVVGTVNGLTHPVVTQVALNDTSHYTFEYTNALQVSVIRNYFGAVERNATVFTYDNAAGDVPRLIDSRVSAQNWTGLNGVPSQVITQYSMAADGACVLTAPDGTIYKEYYGTGWQKGLTVLSEVWAGGVRQKWTTTAWTQDNTSVNYELNPRVIETNTYDASGNRRRTVIDYGQYAQYGLPYWVKEYAADGVTEVRHTFTDYNLSPAYLERRIIGLVSQMHLKDATSYQGKVTYSYDDPARLHALPAAATQHETAYNVSFSARGNLTAVSRWDFTDINNAAKALTTFTNYHTTGTPSVTTDPAGHQSRIVYTDVFSDGLNRNTFAYPTKLIDADGFSSNLQYNFDFGATTRTQSPAPVGQTQGAIQTMSYNSLGQLERITTTNNGAYKRFWYGSNYVAGYATVNNVADESYSVQVTDGLGRVIGAVGNHPGSTGGYSLVNTIYNQMGRAWKVSNPTEVNSSWTPKSDDEAGIYYTQQTYDWNGRPLVTTNPDGTTKEISYAGCGCAGGQVVTLTDEGTIDAGVAKRRQQRIYSDVLGRTVKTEILNWQGGSVYSTAVNTYNVRDQVLQTIEYAGIQGSSSFQTTTLTYDGYGRLKTKHVPEQDAGKNTSLNYNADGTVQKVTDGRGAATIYTYNNRHLLTGVSYSVPSGSSIPVPASSSYSYDAAANRIAMTDGTGSTTYSYDSLSRLTSESRSFNGFSGTYPLNYSYNLANALAVLAIPFRSQQVGYNYDAANRLSGVSATGFTASYYPHTQNISSFASNITYRAWGGRKRMTYGNTTSEVITYNSRLQEATYTLNNMNYQNTNVCCNYPTYNTMTWTYGYYNDGRLKHAWDSTNEWFDRGYKYDHAGRLKEASTYRRARGLSPFPTVPNRDPYYQSISYDVWNHSSRTGLFYTAEPSDAGTYVNNRRSGAGWQYDADGNTARDSSYQHTFDASGTQINSASLAMVGDGSQHPLQPRVEITQSSDGASLPGKRVQKTRQSGIVDEFGNEGPPIEDTQTTHYVRSSVLGGVAVVELNGPGSIDTVNVYAGGQRIARDIWANIIFEHRNPVTGSWVTSLGHSSYRTTNREERDPFGAELPTSNPFAWAESYPDLKFGQPLFIEGGDPFDYGAGCTSFGMPLSCTDAERFTTAGLGQINGIAVSRPNPRGPQGSQLSSKVIEETLIQITHVWLSGGGEGEWRYYRDTVNRVLNVPSVRQQPIKPSAAVIQLVETAFSNAECQNFMKAMLTTASTPDNPVLEGGDIQKIFAAFLEQRNGGILRDRLKGSPFGTTRGRIGLGGEGNGVIHSYTAPSDTDQDLSDATTIINELPHLAGTKEGYPKRHTYDDFALAQAIYKTPYASRSTLKGRYEDDPRIVARFPNLRGPKNAFEAYPDFASAWKNRRSNLWSNYLHDIITAICGVR